MKKSAIFILTILLYSFSYGQTIKELYNNKDYQEIIKFEKKAEKLTPDELYMVGFAFFQLENDRKAIEFYDKAIAKGLDNGSVYFYKSVSSYYSEEYNEALKQIDIALQKEPTNQEFMNHKGQMYRLQGQEDKALEFFVEATKLPNTFGESFFWVAYIYHGKQDFKKALELYYLALEMVPQHNSYYLTTLQSIGQLEYTFTKDFKKSADAYAQVVAFKPKDYEYYPKLIKSFNAAKEFAKADSIFSLMKVAYDRKELSEDDMKYKNVAIDEYEWKEQKVTVWKNLIEPKESLDISYKVYLLNKTGDKVERTFMVEQTIQLLNGPKHLLCEKDKKTNDHLTYPYGWKTDTISLDDLKKAVGLVLDGNMKYSAKSNFGK